MSLLMSGTGEVENSPFFLNNDYFVPLLKLSIYLLKKKKGGGGTVQV